MRAVLILAILMAFVSAARAEDTFWATPAQTAEPANGLEATTKFFQDLNKILTDVNSIAGNTPPSQSDQIHNLRREMDESEDARRFDEMRAQHDARTQDFLRRSQENTYKYYDRDFTSDSSGTIRFKDGTSAYTDSNGTTRFSNGLSAYRDGADTIRFSDGVTATRNRVGDVDFSDGVKCSTDRLGTTTCR